MCGFEQTLNITQIIFRDGVREDHLEDVHVLREDCLLRCRRRSKLYHRPRDEVHGDDLREPLLAGDGRH